MANKIAKKVIKKTGTVKQSNLNSSGAAREINRAAQTSVGIKPSVKSGSVKGTDGGSKGPSGL